jgi:uncharacterized membrane protein
VTRSAPLLIVLCLQASLLFFDLNLLPIWGDELFTLKTAEHPVREIVSIVQQDIHPPLYFLLLHQWEKLPLPWKGVGALRGFSALWALLATTLLDVFWARSLKPVERWLALSLFALSPCLLLYGRMARSYSMQTALALLSLAMLQRWMRTPRSLILSACALMSILGLLYTHYVPGIAVLVGFVLVGWRSVGAARIGIFSFAVAIGYIPWLITLTDAVRRWGRADGFSASYTLSGNNILEHILKIGFGLVSMTIGESFLALSLALVPVILLLALAGARTPDYSRQFVALIAIAAVVGYVGVSRWASYPFIPARLLWLLPFLSLAVAHGISQLNRLTIKCGVVLVMLLSYVSSSIMYFRRENFMNLAYTAPLPEIAATLNREAQPGDLILMDPYDTDPAALSTYLSGRTPYISVDLSSISDSRRRLGSAATVWIVRNTRDISPGRIITEVQADACAGRLERDTLLEPYARWQQAAMKIAGFRPPLTHFYQLTECGQAMAGDPVR